MANRQNDARMIPEDHRILLTVQNATTCHLVTCAYRADISEHQRLDASVDELAVNNLIGCQMGAGRIRILSSHEYDCRGL